MIFKRYAVKFYTILILYTLYCAFHWSGCWNLRYLGTCICFSIAGKTNYTGVLSNSSLKKVHSEWLLPLRVLVSGILAENVNDDSEFGPLTASLLTPVVPVLNHCLELVEDGLKHSMWDVILQWICCTLQGMKGILSYCCHIYQNPTKC